MTSIPGSIHPSRRIALGLTDYLEDFARRHDAETWKQFAEDHPLQWKLAFFEVMNDSAAEVFFNLKNVDVWRGVNRAAAGRGGPTDWELLQIMQHEESWPRIRWYDGDGPRSNPFE